MDTFGSSTPGGNPRRTYDYEAKYPRDKVGKEMEPDARIWHVYNDETEAYDNEMYQRWKDTTDVLLVFTGLFSAVVTTFLVQASTAFNNPEKITASLMFEMVHIQRALANGTSLASVVATPLQPGSNTASTSDYWINGLWIVSLLLALSAALVTLLVKQWLHYYMSRVSGTPLDQALTRHYRFRSLEKWHVENIIELLPFLLHMSLFYFFIGLSVFMWQSAQGLSFIVIVIGISTFLLYMTANLLLTLYSDCPYVTPLAQYVFRLYCSESRFVRAGIGRGKNSAQTLPKSIRDRESRCVRNDIVPAELVVWLHSISANPTVTNICLHTPAGAEAHSKSSPNRDIFRAQLFDVLLDRYSVLTSHLEFQERSEIQNIELALVKLCNIKLMSSRLSDTTRWRIANFVVIMNDFMQLSENIFQEHEIERVCTIMNNITLFLVQFEGDSLLAELIDTLKKLSPTFSIPVVIARSTLFLYLYRTYGNTSTTPPSIEEAAFQVFLQHLTSLATTFMLARESEPGAFSWCCTPVLDSIHDALRLFVSRFTFLNSSQGKSIFWMSQETIGQLLQVILEFSDVPSWLWESSAPWLLWEFSATKSDFRISITKKINYTLEGPYTRHSEHRGKILRTILDHIEETVIDEKYVAEDTCERAVWVRRVLDLDDTDFEYQIYTYRRERFDSLEKEDDEEVVEIRGQRCFRKPYVSKVSHSQDEEISADSSDSSKPAALNTIENTTYGEPNNRTPMPAQAPEKADVASPTGQLTKRSRWLGLEGIYHRLKQWSLTDYGVDKSTNESIEMEAGMSTSY